MWQSTQASGVAAAANALPCHSLYVVIVETPLPGVNCWWHPPQNCGLRRSTRSAEARALCSWVQS